LIQIHQGRRLEPILDLSGVGRQLRLDPHVDFLADRNPTLPSAGRGGARPIVLDRRRS
jgi:hypothetical protein